MVSETIVDDQVEWVLSFLSFLIQLKVADVFKEAYDYHAQDLFWADLASEMQWPVASARFDRWWYEILRYGGIANPESNWAWARLQKLLDKVGLVPNDGQMESWLPKLVPCIQVQLRWALKGLAAQSVNAPAAPAGSAAPGHQEVHWSLPWGR